MVGKLVMNILQVNTSTGVSANLKDSSGAGVKVHHARVPQGDSFPAVVYDVENMEFEFCKDELKEHEYRVRFTVFHEDDYEAATIAENLLTIVDGWKGDYDGETWFRTNVDGGSELYNDELALHMQVLDFIFTKKA